jgi:hypothetical protein
MPPQLELQRATEPRYSEIIGRPIDNTVLSTYMRCPSEAIKAYWMHRRNEKGTKPSLGYGTAWHAGMEAIYKAPEMSEADLIEVGRLAIAEKWEDHGIADDMRTFERCCLELKKHLKTYGLPWLQDVKTVGWPENPMVEMSAEVAIPGARHPYTVKVDRLTIAAGQYGFDDHKTASRDEGDYFSSYELDNQMMGYAVGGQLLSGHIIGSARIRRHVIRTKDSVHDQRNISFSQPRLIAWCANYERWLIRLERDLIDWKGLIAQGMDPYTAADVAFPLNKAQCATGRKYGHCPYMAVCSLPPSLRGRSLEDDYEINVWNPLEAGTE